MGSRASFSRIESERFVVDRAYHIWIYHVSTRLKLGHCKIELPKSAEEITVTDIERGISFRSETNVVILEKKYLSFFSSFELSVSFVTRPRMDEVISYVSEEPEVADSRHCVKKIIVQNKQTYEIDRIRLERILDFEPPVFKVEELSAGGTTKEILGLIETSKDNLGRTTKSVLTWETSFHPLERKSFRISYESKIEEEKIATSIVKFVTQANLLFKKATSVEQVFQDSMLIADELHTPLKSDRDFAHKIGSLCQLFEVPLDPLRKLLNVKANEGWRSIKLIEEWLKQKGLSDPTMVKTWRYIVGIRDKSLPFHHPDGRIIRFCEYFGQNYPPNYFDFWICILDKFKESIEKFVGILAKI